MTTQSLYKSPAGQQAIMALYDRVLAHWPVPHDELDLPTCHGHTFVIASGPPSAPPLVLLHGANSNAVSWVGNVAELSRSLRVYAVDELGQPGKSAPNRPPYTGPAYVDWLDDVLDGLGLRSTSLLGLSEGGWLALKFATARPERVDKLILLAPGGVAPVRLSFLLRAIPLSMLGPRGGAAVNRIVFGRQPIHPDAVVFMDAIMAHFRSRISAHPLHTDADLRRLVMPVLLVLGAKDAIVPSARVAARLGGLLPRLTSVVLPDAGHVLVDTNALTLPFRTATP